MFEWKLINNKTNITYALGIDPNGWENIVFTHERSKRYDGIFYGSSSMLSFTCNGGGKEYIDDAYEQYGSEADMTLLLKYRCDSSEYYFEWKLNFSTYRENYIGNVLYTTIDIEARSIAPLIAQREGHDVDLLATESLNGMPLQTYNFCPYEFIFHSKLVRLTGSWRSDTQFTDVPALQPGYSAQGDPGVDGQYFVRIINSVPFQSNVFVSVGVPVYVSDIKQSIQATPMGQAVLGFSFDSTTDDLGKIIDTSGQSDILGSGEYTVNVNWNICGTYYDKIIDGAIISRDLGLGGGDMLLYLFHGPEKPGGYPPSGVLLAQIPYYSTLSASYSATFSNSGNAQISIRRGDKVWLVWLFTYRANAAASSTYIRLEYIYDCFDITFNLDSTTEQSNGDVVAIYEAWSRICESITDQPVAFKSEFFGRTNSQPIAYPSNGYGAFTAVTDGLRLRGKRKGEAQSYIQQDCCGNEINVTQIEHAFTSKGIICKLKDMYDACNAIWGIGLGIERHNGYDVVRVEEKEYFYNDTEIMYIPDPANVERRFVVDSAYSIIELGYDKWRINDYNGLDEPNTIARWTAPKIKSFTNTLRLVSPYVCGMYAIEMTRRKNIFAGFGSEDTEYDDAIFLIATNRTVKPNGLPFKLNLAERNENINVISNLIDPSSSYNLRFNLFSNFDRVMNQFTIGLTKDMNHIIKNIYFEGNGAMRFQFNDGHSGDLNGFEAQNTQDTEYANSRHRRQHPVYLPEEYTFSYPIGFSGYIDIINNPYGYIKFEANGTKMGYIKTFNYHLKTGMADFTLIRKYDG